MQKLNFFGAPLLSPEQQARLELAELDAQVGGVAGSCLVPGVLLFHNVADTVYQAVSALQHEAGGAAVARVHASQHVSRQRL